MEHIAAIMVLIGCGDGDVQCRELASPTVGYETVAMCESEMEPVLRQYSSDHPVVYGQCAEVDPALFEQDAVVAWDFRDNGDLHVDVVPSDSLYAASEVSVTKTSR